MNIRSKNFHSGVWLLLPKRLVDATFSASIKSLECDIESLVLLHTILDQSREKR